MNFFFQMRITFNEGVGNLFGQYHAACWAIDGDPYMDIAHHTIDWGTPSNPNFKTATGIAFYPDSYFCCLERTE